MPGRLLPASPIKRRWLDGPRFAGFRTRPWDSGAPRSTNSAARWSSAGISEACRFGPKRPPGYVLPGLFCPRTVCRSNALFCTPVLRAHGIPSFEDVTMSQGIIASVSPINPPYRVRYLHLDSVLLVPPNRIGCVHGIGSVFCPPDRFGRNKCTVNDCGGNRPSALGIAITLLPPETVAVDKNTAFPPGIRTGHLFS